jgi:hypothetical protein
MCQRALFASVAINYWCAGLLGLFINPPDRPLQKGAEFAGDQLEQLPVHETVIL